MKGKKTSSLSDALRAAEQKFSGPRKAEDEFEVFLNRPRASKQRFAPPTIIIQDEEREALLLEEKAKRKSYEEDKKRFRQNHKAVPFSPISGIFSQSKPESLDIPIGNYRRLAPPFWGLFEDQSKVKSEPEYKITKIRWKDSGKKTLCSQIFQIIKKNNEPMHIDRIIIALQRSGHLKSGLHIYATVYRTLTRNLIFFRKIGKATFSLRKGFIKWAKQPKSEKIAEETEDFTTLQKLVINAVKQISPEQLVSCPSSVFQLLRSVGYNGQYKSIYNVMQSPSFRKDGFSYHLVQ